jgi:hypothetical protein
MMFDSGQDRRFIEFADEFLLPNCPVRTESNSQAIGIEVPFAYRMQRYLDTIVGGDFRFSPESELSDTLGPAAKAIMDKIQCADAIAAMSVPGAASLAVQAHGYLSMPELRF